MKRIIVLSILIVSVTALAAAQIPRTEPFRQEGIASWYGHEFAGRPTASGEIFDPTLFTAAHPDLPFGTIVRVTNMHNMQQVTVRINDRGPFVAARIMDLSMQAAEAIDMIRTGTAHVFIEEVLNTALGPVPPGINPLAPITAPPVTAIAPIHVEPQPPVHIPVTPAAPIAAAVPQAAPVTAPAVAPVSAPVFFPAPPAVIRGPVPPIGCIRLYRLQVGAYKVPRNAVDAFARLRSAGLNPAYEKNGDFYRVVLPGLRAEEIPSIAQILGNSGFREAILRVEN